MRRPRYFQWIEGDLEGTVSILDYIEDVEGEYFYNFTDGESCNLRFISKMTRDINSLKGKVMVEIATPNDMWVAEDIKTHHEKVMDPTYGEQSVEVPPIEEFSSNKASGSGNSLSLNDSMLGKRKYRAPRYKGPFSDLPSLDDYYKDETENNIKNVEILIEPSTAYPAPEVVYKSVETPMVERTVERSTSKIAETDPVRILAKTCKKHPTDVEMTITIDLPNRSIYNIAVDEFEDGGDKFIECLVENIDVNIIIKSITDSLKAAYTQNDSSEI